MRGKAKEQMGMICLLNVEERIGSKHPIRGIKKIIGSVLQKMQPTLDGMYSRVGRPSIPPERLLGARVLQALYSVRSDRQFCERLQYDLLFQWFLNLNPDESAFDASSFSKNMERLLEHEVAVEFFQAVVAVAKAEKWMSNEHFSVDGTLIEAWASMKSFRPKDEPKGPPEGRNGWKDFKGDNRSNNTHESRTDTEAKLVRKGPGKEARLSFGAHALMENRHGLCVAFRVEEAVGKECTESAVALKQLNDLRQQGFRPRTVGADKGYHNGRFLRECRDLKITPHVAVAKGRINAVIDRRTTRHEGYRLSQCIRKRIEELFGWMKTTGNLRKSRWKGVARTQMAALFTASTYNLLRMVKLSALTADPPVTAVA